MATKKRFEYKITLGKRIDGSLLRKSIYSTKSKADAKKKAEQYLFQYNQEHFLDPTAIIEEKKFSEWAMVCLETYKKPYIKGNTYEGTCLAPVKNHLIPYFGNRPLSSILPAHIQAYINQASEKHAPETVKKDHAMLSLIFETAVDNGFCQKNPVTKSIRLLTYHPVKEKHAYAQEEYDIVYNFAKTHPDGLAIMLLMETGISRSELLGIQWKDLDLENHILHIRQGVALIREEGSKKRTAVCDGLKNRFRERDIPLVDISLIERLKCAPRIARPKRANGSCKKEDSETIFVFHSPSGTAYRPDTWANRVYRPFVKDLKAAYPEIPELSLHELRHTRATLWIEQGIDPYLVARLLGHSDLKMLTKIYDHTRQETLRNALIGAKDRKNGNAS